MTIDPINIFEYVVIHLPSDTMVRTPGVELISLSIVMNPYYFSLGNVSTELRPLASEILVLILVFNTICVGIFNFFSMHIIHTYIRLDR